jgi:hypothetical protein
MMMMRGKRGGGKPHKLLEVSNLSREVSKLGTRTKPLGKAAGKK